MLLLSAALLLGMQTAPDPVVQIVLKVSNEACIVLVDGASVDQDALEARVAGWARSGRAVVLSGDENTPYRCVGSAMFALQKAGFRTEFGYAFSPSLRIELTAVIKLSASQNCEITINGKPVTFPQYDQLAAEWGRNQPEIHFQPDPNVEFECVDRMLKVLRKYNTTKLGFIGNAQYVVPEDPQ